MADCPLFIVSKNDLERENEYVQEQLELFQMLGKRIENKGLSSLNNKDRHRNSVLSHLYDLATTASIGTIRAERIVTTSPNLASTSERLANLLTALNISYTVIY